MTTITTTEEHSSGRNTGTYLNRYSITAAAAAHTWCLVFDSKLIHVLLLPFHNQHIVGLLPVVGSGSTRKETAENINRPTTRSIGNKKNHT